MKKTEYISCKCMEYDLLLEDEQCIENYGYIHIWEGIHNKYFRWACHEQNIMRHQRQRNDVEMKFWKT